MRAGRNEPENKRKSLTMTLYASDFVWAAAIAALFVVTLELFYRMIVDYNGKYGSDVRYYVVENVKEGIEHDRLLTILFQFFYDINQGTLEANIYLAAVIAAIVVVNYFFIRYLLRASGPGVEVPRYAIQFFSVAMLFIGPMYVPVLHEWFYKKSFQSFAWHSPTQQSMTLAAMIAAMCFMKMYSGYEEQGVKLPWWIATAVTTLIATSCKPSYTISLCVAVVVMFIVDLIRGGREGLGRRFGRLFLMGCSIIPSGLYMILLHTSEFSEGEQFGEEHKVIFDIAHVLNYEHLWAAVIFGIAFPLLVFCMCRRKFKDDRYRFILYIFVMGVLQWALIGETGTRGNFGNFAWGRIFGSYMITLAACAAALEMIYDKSSKETRFRKVRLAAVGVVLIWSVLSQLYYFRLILTGHGYLH